MIPKKWSSFGGRKVCHSSHLYGILQGTGLKKRGWWTYLVKNKLVTALIVASMLISTTGIGIAKYIDGKKATITLNDDGRIVQITTMEKTVGDILGKYQIQLKADDELSPSKKEKVEDGTVITIRRAMTVYITADEKQDTVSLATGTVGDALKKAGVTFDENDEISPAPEEIVTPGMNIRVARVDEKIIVEKDSIPYEVVTKKDSGLKSGVEKILQNGKQGEREIKIQVVYRDGKEIGRRILSDTVTAKPLDKIIVRGTAQPKPVRVASRSSSTRPKTSSGSTGGSIGNMTYKSVKVMQSTAYTYTGSRTATGAVTKRGIVAVDPRVIPLGTRLYIEGYGYGIAADTGGAIKGNIIDVFMETTAEALRWGRRTVHVYILK